MSFNYVDGWKYNYLCVFFFFLCVYMCVYAAGVIAVAITKREEELPETFSGPLIIVYSFSDPSNPQVWQANKKILQHTSKEISCTSLGENRLGETAGTNCTLSFRTIVCCRKIWERPLIWP